MAPDSPRALVRTLAIGLVAVAVALIAASLWPRVSRVERKAIAPAVNAVRPRAAAGDAAATIAAACPAVVAIDLGSGMGRSATPGATAPGFLVSADGYVVASGRRVGAATTPRVRLNDGRIFTARRIGGDMLSGLTLFKIDADNLPTLRFDEGSLPAVGATGLAVMAPLARGCVAEAAMVGADFSTEGAGARAYVRLRPGPDAAFAGAPVLGVDGKVIGIAGLGAADGDAADPALLLPGGTAARVVSAVMRGGGDATDAFGLIARDLSPALAARIGVARQQGAMIALVAPVSAGARAGLQAGDVIFTADGTPVANATELARALDGGGEVVTLDVMRRTDRISITMRLR
jgi:serine protease Do